MMKGMKFIMTNWEEYYKIHKQDEIKPNRILEKVITRMNEIKLVTDIGCGAGTDTIYLLQKGMKVYAIDKEDTSLKVIKQRLKDINKENLLKDLHFIKEKFENSRLPSVDLVNSYNSLSYCDPNYFDSFIIKIKNSINMNGIFVGNFFGVEDSWNGRKNMTFLSKEEVIDLFKDFDIIELSEIKKKGVTSLKKEKFWHFIDVIAIKNNAI